MFTGHGVNLNNWFRLPRAKVNGTVRTANGGHMKRIFTLAILFHWMMFFALHAFGALAGKLEIAQFYPFSGQGTAGAAPAMPVTAAGLGLVALLASALFTWAFLALVLRSDAPNRPDLELEKLAFGCSAVIFTALSMIAIISSEPMMLLYSTSYYTALLVSWAVSALEYDRMSARADWFKETEAVRHARKMAGEAAWNINLTRISGRKGTH